MGGGGGGGGRIRSTDVLFSVNSASVDPPNVPKLSPRTFSRENGVAALIASGFNVLRSVKSVEMPAPSTRTKKR
jgi:hypothetical protein